MTGVRQFILTVLFSVGTLVVSSQPQNPEGEVDVVPITGLEILLISGGAYGISQLRRKGNSKKSEM